MAAAVVPDRVHDGPTEDPEKAASIQDVTDEESGTPTARPAQELQRWNESSTNIFRFLSSIYAFILMGMTDGAMGVCSQRSPPPPHVS